MKATIIACADRAVGALAASIGLVFLAMTVRALAPIGPIAPTFEPPATRVADSVVSQASPARHPAQRSSPKVRPLQSHTHVVRVVARGRTPSTTARSHVRVSRPIASPQGHSAPTFASPRTRSPLTIASRGRRTFVATASAPQRSSLPLARPRGASPLRSVLPNTSIATAHRATIAASRARSVGAIAPHPANQSGARRDGRAAARVALRPGPAVRSSRKARLASTSLRFPAKFDVRPPLVVVSDASEAALPATDALPTIATRKRRH